MTAERISRLAGGDHEQAAIEVDQVVDAAEGGAMHRLESPVHTAAVERVVIPRTRDRDRRVRPQHRDATQERVGKYRLVNRSPSPCGGVGAKPGGQLLDGFVQ